MLWAQQTKNNTTNNRRMTVKEIRKRYGFGVFWLNWFIKKAENQEVPIITNQILLDEKYQHLRIKATISQYWNPKHFTRVVICRSARIVSRILKYGTIRTVVRLLLGTPYPWGKIARKAAGRRMERLHTYCKRGSKEENCFTYWKQNTGLAINSQSSFCLSFSVNRKKMTWKTAIFDYFLSFQCSKRHNLQYEGLRSGWLVSRRFTKT
jgi:hypothetical protein